MKDDRISCLFTDYDGTLSPLDVDVEESWLSSSLDAVLREISGKSKLAVVTSKSFEFISRRIPYAHAWGCICGLVVRFDDGKEFTVSPSIDVGRGLEEAKEMLGNTVTYEEKRSSASLLGFSLNWRGNPVPPGLARVVAKLKQEGYYVSHDISDPFADFFCSPPDKGGAVSRIKKAFGLSGATMFMGDSTADNPAFLEVDVPVGVDHGQKLDSLRCEFLLNYGDVAPFLRALSQQDMVFTPALPGLRRE
jgi:hypothetical protein